jgi:hypothetical protein
MKLKVSRKVVGLEKAQLFDQLKLLPRLAVLEILLVRKVFTADSVTLASEVGAVHWPSPL